MSQKEMKILIKLRNFSIIPSVISLLDNSFTFMYSKFMLPVRFGYPIIILLLIIFFEMVFLQFSYQQPVREEREEQTLKLYNEYYDYYVLENALNNDTLTYLFFLKRGVLKDSVAHNVYEGTIEEIYREPKIFAFTQFYRGLKIQSEGISGYVFFRKNEFNNMSIVDNFGNTIQFADLRKGMNVKIDEDVDLVVKKPDKVRHFKITLSL